ncbi:gas vesicle protein GvpL/GvpF [Haloactinopolyspora alba]|uniref:Gas vesicle protein GvpL/GvpF n=1 Tax=Haloactinopolyspora alba TaxID=648780 RepID=A0A2P8D3V3_9ACTN|nr:GvpL/GvpF family gas vesicle protein [Haloactinopolyspora alba]PSK91897.1 gas vesicle protein GvpL/GvpF [Haloactinopolyspora alba]
MGEAGRYMYAISRWVDPAELAELRGLGGAEVQAVEHEGLLAIVSTVGLDEFGEDELSEHLQDLDWLDTVARTHHEVVSGVASRAPTAPLRLATVCMDDASVRSRLARWAPDLRQVLDRVAGRAEWSVKVFAGPIPEPVPAAREVSTAPGSGAAYLARRKAHVDRLKGAAEQAATAADDVHDELTRHATAARRLALQDGRLTGEEATMTLNAAYLVDSSASDEFRAATQALRDRHPDERVDLTGPWPAYSFAAMDET